MGKDRPAHCGQVHHILAYKFTCVMLGRSMSHDMSTLPIPHKLYGSGWVGTMSYQDGSVQNYSKIG